MESIYEMFKVRVFQLAYRHTYNPVIAEDLLQDVFLKVSEAKSISAKSLSGNVLYQGRIDPQGRYTLKSHSGDLRMTIPADSAFEFDAETFSGVIDLKKS